MENEEIKLEQPMKSWQGNRDDKKVKSITFCVTEACNLTCRYCYMTGKNNRKKMSFETAKKCVDFILSHTEYFN